MSKMENFSKEKSETELDPVIEEQIKTEAIKFLKNGKEGWDIPHTLEAVRVMKILIKNEGGNPRILIPVMYLHDTGYKKLNNDYDYDDLMDAKDYHEENGAKNAKKVLPKLDFTPEEVEEIAELISLHDHMNMMGQKYTPKDMQLVFEADSLAQINWNNVTPNFDEKNCNKFLKYFQVNRQNRIITETGKKLLAETMEIAQNFWKNKK